MKQAVKFSSKRFLLTLSLASCSVILLYSKAYDGNRSFPFELLCLFGGSLITVLMFIPAIILKKKYESDVFSVLSSSPKWIKNLSAAFYILWFLYTAEYFLLPYFDMFRTAYYPEAAELLISFIFVAVCCYASYRGVNAITRFGIFFFLFSVFVKLTVFSGSIGSLDFSDSDLVWRGDLSGFIEKTVFFAAPSFVCVIFASAAGSTDNFKISQPLLIILLETVEFALVLFFIFFALGDYAFAQKYQTFSLAHASHLGGFGGFESFYLALVTLTVFMVTSLVLSCACRAVEKERSLGYSVLFSAILFVLTLCAGCNKPVSEAVFSPPVLLLFTIAGGVVIPLIILLLHGRNKNV